MTERDIFLALLDLADPTERSAFLTRACAGDTALRERVDSLLDSHDNAGSFLGTPALPHLGSPEGDRGRGEEAPPDDGVTQDLAAQATADDGGAAAASNDFFFLAASTRPDSLGRLGHYEVLEVLGKGGFGIVFRAFDEQLQRVVAIKVLAPEMAETSPARRRFLREARSSARVRHENVVQVYAVEEEPLPYLVMEFVPGETLQQRLDRIGPLEVAEVVQLGRQIAEGLAVAHATGLIHRDIKPANILIEVGPHAHVKITDFGLARAADDASLTQSGIISGTPMYMAPEQASADTLDHRADLFSLGSVLYAMCTGRSPFRAPSTLAVLKRVAEDTPRPIRQIIPEVPEWLCDLIARLHAKKPEDRLQSAHEVAELLMRGEGRGTRDEGRGTTHGGRETREESLPLAPRPSSLVPRWAAAVLLLLLGGLGVTEGTGVTNVRATVIRLFSPEGTLVVEVDDPGVSVQIDGSDLVITGAGAREIRLKPGRYTVEARKDGKVVSQELVSITSNGRQVVRVSQEPVIAAKGATEKKSGTNDKPSAPAIGPFTDADVQRIAALPAAEQVEEVRKELMRRNPGFDGKFGHKIEGGVVTEFKIVADNVTDIAPIRVWNALRALKCAGSLPHKGLLADLSPLKGMNLASLKQLELHFTNVTDAGLAHFKGCTKLTLLNLAGDTQVTDAGLAHFKDCKDLYWLAMDRTQVTDAGLAHFKGMPRVRTLWIYQTDITDLTPVQGMPLESILLTPKNITKGLDILRDMKSLKTIGIRVGSVWPAAEFWERYDKGEFGTPPGPTVHDTWLKAVALLPLNQHAAALPAKLKERLPGFDDAFLRAIPAMAADRQTIMAEAWLKERKPAFAGFEDAWLKAIPAMPADTQLVLVAAWLRECNPSFDGEVTHKIEGGVVTSLEVPSPLVHDLRPLGALTGLRSLTCLNPVGYDNKAESDAAVLRSLTKLDNINGKPVAQFWKEVEARPAEFKEWLQLVATLNANQKVAAVAAKLKERNPGFDGNVGRKIEDGAVTQLTFKGENVTDLSPVRALVGLKYLKCDRGPLSDLSPLKGMPLTTLNLGRTQVQNLSLLKGMQLTYLHLVGCPVQNLEPLKGMQLTSLNLSGCKEVRDLEPLKGMPLTSLSLGDTKVRDLEPLKGMPLTTLYLDRTKVQDLELLKGMPLKKLSCYGINVTDLTPLQGMELEDIRLTPKNITKGLDILRDMKSLKTIGVGGTGNQAWPAAEFWERYDKGEFGKAAAPFTDADVKRIAALPAAEQVEEVRKELMRRNPGFDGKVGHKIQDGVVTEIRIVTDQVTDIAPIRVWSALRVLDCQGTQDPTTLRKNGQLADLTPLQGMNLAQLAQLNLRATKVADAGMAHFKDCKNLTILRLYGTPVSDAGVAAFKDCKKLTLLELARTNVTDIGLANFDDCTDLTVLYLSNLNVSDAGLAYFKDCKKLTTLFVGGTKITDAGLAHFKDCKNLTRLDIAGSLPKVTDLSLLKGMPLKDIRLTPKNITMGLDILRDMKTLKTIGIDYKQPWPAAEFWERYDKGEFQK